MDIKFTLDRGAYAPEKAHAGDAGYDLRLPGNAEEIRVIGGWTQSIAINTGVHVAIPKGYVGIVTSKSGLNVNHGIICPPGVIDSGYTGSIVVKLYAMEQDSHMQFEPGDKVAQLLIMPIADCRLVQAERLEDTERGDGGFGSTGK